LRKFYNFHGIAFIVGWLVVTPVAAFADEVTITLTPEIPYVDTVVVVDTTTAYTITTTTGPRTEIVDSQTVERVAWVDSWLTLYQGLPSESGTVIAQDDDSNHNSQTNYYASALSGVLQPDTYTIRATSYDYVVAGQRPIGTYTLSSNLINLPDTSTAQNNDTSTATNNPASVDGSTATTAPSETTTATTPAPSQPIEIESSPSTPASITPNPQPIQPPVVIESNTNQVPLPTTQEQVPEPPIEEPAIVEESVLPDEPILEEIQELPILEEVQESPLEEPLDTPVEETADEPTITIEESQEPITEEEVDNLVAELTADGTLSTEDRQEVAEALIEASQGEPITTETIIEAGLTYEDLPAATPVEVRQDENGNAVVITAEVAAALLVLDNPVELLTTIFDDPAQAFLALTSIGADMSEEEREESEKTIVAAVIVGGIAVQSATSAALAGSVSYRRRV